MKKSWNVQLGNNKTILIQSFNKIGMEKSKQCVHQVKKIYTNNDEESKSHHQTIKNTLLIPLQPKVNKEHIKLPVCIL